jgi:hypothetical protein
MMTFYELGIYERFSIEQEPHSLFYKETNRYDGAVNAYKIKDENRDNMLEPVIFGRENKVTVVSQ